MFSKLSPNVSLSGKFLLVEYVILGIHFKESGIPLTIWIWNPVSGIRNPGASFFKSPDTFSSLGTVFLFNRFWTRKVSGPFERRTSGERVEYRIQLRLSCTILHGDEVKSKKKLISRNWSCMKILVTKSVYVRVKRWVDVKFINHRNIGSRHIHFLLQTKYFDAPSLILAIFLVNLMNVKFSHMRLSDVSCRDHHQVSVP